MRLERDGISKIGDAEVRTVLYEAANVILTRPVKGSALKSWAARLALRGHAQGEGGTRPKVGRRAAQNACRRYALRRRPRRHAGLKQGRRDHGFGQRRTPTARSEVPSLGRWIRPGRRPLGGPQR